MTPAEPRWNAVACLSARGFHRMRYCEWGDREAAGVVVCVHGLTRNARDFDALARTLTAADCRVVCPDVVGRGASDWLADPAEYGFARYLADMAVLLARLGAERVDWVGTSMGALIGMMLAAQDGHPLRRLVLNDVGPVIPQAALRRIADYVGTDPRFPDMATAESYIRAVHAPFGALDDAQWRHLTESSVAPADGGQGYRLRYDPAIGAAFAELAEEDVDLWSVWDRVTVPTLVLRGADSDLLPRATAQEMTQRGPRAEVVEIAGCGHAPALLDAAQTGLIRDWLLRT
jgi:pimeloyl-ACP methyl ester carboxylesterase